MSANEVRGEVEITLAGKAYRLRPSFAAMQAVEKKTERSLRQLAVLAQGADLSLTEVGHCLREMIAAGAEPDDAMSRNLDAGKLAELAYEEGAAKVQLILFALLFGAVTGGVTASGEAKAAVATDTTIAA